MAAVFAQQHQQQQPPNHGSSATDKNLLESFSLLSERHEHAFLVDDAGGNGSGGPISFTTVFLQDEEDATSDGLMLQRLQAALAGAGASNSSSSSGATSAGASSSASSDSGAAGDDADGKDACEWADSVFRSLFGRVCSGSGPLGLE
jgi:hypothetical protein